MFAIVDIETAGGRPQQGGITEIAVILHDGYQSLSTYQTLLNPERPIPSFITGLTGIDEQMVADAPRFEEIAHELYALLEDKIFIAHNVNFDFSFLQTHFEQCGLDFKPTKLCSVRWARKVIPGMKSYSLGRLCENLSIPVTNRHRAMGDAEATAILVEKLLQSDKEGYWKKLSKPGKRHYLPEHLDEDSLKTLPDQTGVYYFKNAKGKVLYVGKAKSIKSRVRSHFTGKNGQEKQALIREIAVVDYELTGNEFIAHLLEVSEIKRHFPPFNKAQKYPDPRYGLFPWMDRAGFVRMSMAKVAKGHQPIFSDTSRFGLRNLVHRTALALDLCPRLCGVEMEAGKCSPMGSPCPGYCSHAEMVSEHNLKMHAFIDAFKDAFEDEVYVHKGRVENELGFVLFEGGTYQGYGFMPSEELRMDKEHLSSFLIAKKPDAEVERIIALFRKNPHQGSWIKLTS
jgi:DNA polymerase-3 subunit epsilon